MVGYTNAGKSTLLNLLTGADVVAENKLFATLDPTMRRTHGTWCVARFDRFISSAGHQSHSEFETNAKP